MLMTMVTRSKDGGVSTHTAATPLGQSPATDDDDRTLLRRVAAQDRQAFETLYYRYARRLAGYLTRYTRRPELVEEVLDDVMLIVWQNAARFNDTSRVSTWIFGIASRRAMKALALTANRPLTMPPTPPEEQSHQEDPADIVTRQEFGATLASALATLSPEQRAVVELTFYHEYSYQEIASITDCPVNTVKTRLFHARQRLAHFFTDWGVRRAQGGRETSA